MIFLGNLTIISETTAHVGLTHSMPFDEINGMKHDDGSLFTIDELNQIGTLVDTLPLEQPPAGQIKTGTFVDTVTKEVTYTYGTPPLTVEQRLALAEKALDSLIMGV